MAIRKKSLINGQTHSLIADGTEVKGDISYVGNLHIQGRVIGNVSVDGDAGQLIITQTGSVEGEITVPRVIINGYVNGNVHASEYLELAESAEVEGNVFYDSIEMVKGSSINGKLIHQGERRNLPSPDQFSADSAHD